jgi:hypothetical protein
LGVSRQGSSKTQNILAKSPCQNFFQNFNKNFSVSVFPRFFGFIAFSGVFLAMGVQKHYRKNVLQPKACRKVFTKKSTKSPKPTFGRFRVLGSPPAPLLGHPWNLV